VSAVLLLVGALAAPPPSLSAPVRRSLSEQSVTASRLRFWIRRTAPRRRPTPDAGSAFSFQRSSYAIVPGTLIGAVEVLDVWTDARGQPIRPGVYTLRYALQPLTKDHHGVSAGRDFLVLVPAARDRSPAVRPDFDELVAASRLASGTGHPAIIALVPLSDDEPDTIRLGQFRVRLVSSYSSPPAT
jgi:hypothetical protein